MWLAGCKMEQGDAAKNIVSLASNLARDALGSLTLLGGIPDWDAGGAGPLGGRNISTPATTVQVCILGRSTST